MLAILLFACSGGDTDTTKDTTGDSGLVQGDYLSEDVDLGSPTFEASTVAAAVDSALSQVLDINAVPVVSLYTAFMDATTESCPQWTTFDEYPVWLDSCTTEDGVTFDGYGLMLEYDGFESDGAIYSGYQINSLGAMSAPDGSTLTLAGAVDLLYAVGKGYEVFYTNISDGTAWDGAATGTWLDWGINPAMYFYALRDTTSGARSVQVSGSVSIEDGDISAVVFDGLYLLDDPSGTLCSAEPSGMISILSAEGQWYDLVFDGPTEDNTTVPEETCDGCATAWFKGEALGEACVDFSALVDWDDNPWGL